jgi:hypothetical protein
VLVADLTDETLGIDFSLLKILVKDLEFSSYTTFRFIIIIYLLLIMLMF